MTSKEHAVIDAAVKWVSDLDSTGRGNYGALRAAVRALAAPEAAAADTTADRERWQRLYEAAIAGMSALPHDDGTGGSVICIVEDAIHLADRALAAEKARWPR